MHPIIARGLLGVVTLCFNSSATENDYNYDYNYNYGYDYDPIASLLYDLGHSYEEIYDNSISFPRCCFSGYVYDIENRNCVPFRNETPVYKELNIDVNGVWGTLLFCDVISDRFVKKGDVKVGDGNGTLQIGNEVFQYMRFCLDNVLQSNEHYVIRLCHDIDYCLNVSRNVRNEWCVHKCCIEGMSLQDFECVLSDEMGVNVENNTRGFERRDGYAMLFGTDLKCERTDWNEFRDVKARIKANGSLFMGHGSTEYLVTDYCLGTNYDTMTNTTSDMIFSCEFREALYPRWIFIRVVIVITCVSFVIILIVYMFVYRLKKLFEQIVTCFSLVELVFWCMYSMRIYDIRIGKFCSEFAYTYFFITISRLSWLNIISYEIWRTICSLTTRSIGQTRQALRGRMICYALYAVLIPTTATLAFILGNQEVYRLPTRFKPLVHKATCFLDVRRLDGNLGLLHFYIPVSILITINIVLFIKTALYILKTKKDLRKIKDSNNGDKLNMDVFKRGFIILKLGLIMGLSSYSYYFYIYISTFNINKTLQQVFDIISFSDIFEGILFLLVFVVKWDILKSLLNRLNIFSSNFLYSQSPNPASSSKKENQVTSTLASRIKVT